jgi:hypothetical protein
MDHTDPTAAETIGDLAACLRHVHVRAGKPSYRDLEQKTIHDRGPLPGTRFNRARLTRSIVSDALNGRKLPGKAFFLTFVSACGIDLESDHRWEEAWDRLAARHYLGAASPPSTDAETQRLARENEELRRKLAVLQQAADSASGTGASLPDVVFDPTIYGMSADYDDQGNYAYPTGFDPEAGEWLAGFDAERDKWEKLYADARRRFNAHRRLFAISGQDLTVTVTATADELEFGKTIEVWPPGRDQALSIKLPAGTPSGKVLRLPDHGLPLLDGSGAGTLLITVAVGTPGLPTAATAGPTAKATTPA